MVTDQPVAGPAACADLVAEGAAEPVEGWDFSWFAGRATEERPAWGYSQLLGERMADAKVALDVQTGGGEVLAAVPRPAPVLVATESWPPNLAVAQRNLRVRHPLAKQPRVAPGRAFLGGPAGKPGEVPALDRLGRPLGHQVGTRRRPGHRLVSHHPPGGARRTGRPRGPGHR